MRLVGAAQVRDEADIIEAFVRHNLTVIDAIAIVDHGSNDGTVDVLRKLVAEGLPVFLGHESDPEFDQQTMKNRLVRHVFATSDADWVFPLDADEFFKVPDRGALEAWLREHAQHADVSLEWQTYVPSFEQADTMSALASARRVRDDAHGLHKVAVSRVFAGRPDLYLTKGQHRVESNSSTLQRVRRLLPHGVAALAHVPIRSARQFTRKMAVAGLASLNVPLRERNESVHVREAYAYLRSGRPITSRQLEAFALNYSVPMERWLPSDAHVLDDEPFLADFTLAYRRDADLDPLALVLRAAETMIRKPTPAGA